MKLTLTRDVFASDYTLGRLHCDGVLLGFICEDTDRKLEAGGVKIPGKTAIPRGCYPITLSLSQRFKRVMPEITEVPGFTGIRIHGGNTAADTQGCPLLGATRTAKGVRDCAALNVKLIDLLRRAESQGTACQITVE